MGDVDGIAEAIQSNGDTTDVAVGNGIDMLAFNAIGTDVETAVKMMRTGLAKVPRQ